MCGRMARSLRDWLVLGGRRGGSGRLRRPVKRRLPLPKVQSGLVPMGSGSGGEVGGDVLGVHRDFARRSGQLIKQAARAAEAGRCDRGAIRSHLILGRVLVERFRLRVPQPVPSPARKKAMACSAW